MKRHLIATALTLGVAAGFAATADIASAGSPDIVVSAKGPGDPYADVADIHVAKGTTETVKLRIETSTLDVEEGFLNDVSDPPPDCGGFKTRYFTKNGKNISSEVKSPGGFELTVQPDKPKTFKMRVKRPAAADRRTLLAVQTSQTMGDTDEAVINVNKGNENCPMP
jgi:hypothetical protein